MATSDSQRSWTRDRFYTIDGRQFPSVTTILDVIAKPGLGPWYAKQERQYFETGDARGVVQARRPRSRVRAGSGGRGRERCESSGPGAAAGLGDRDGRPCRDRMAASDDDGRGRRARAVLARGRGLGRGKLEGLGIECRTRAPGHRTDRVLRRLWLCGHAGPVRAGQRALDGPRLEERQGHLSRGLSPECGLPPRRETPGHAVGPRAHRPTPEA